MHVIRPARIRALAACALLALGLCAPAAARAQGADPVQAAVQQLPTLAGQLAEQAPLLDPHVLSLALAAHDKALAEGLLGNPNVLTVIDYSRASIDPRFWVFDLATRKLLFQELVAHGRNSGDNYATRFSNEESSLESSFGLYVTADVYVGKHGRSLKIDGLERGWNDNAEARGIVVHAADYVSPALAAARGRIGRSWGCPALSPAVAMRVIDTIKGGSAMFAYYPDSTWLATSSFLEQPAPADSDTLAPALDSSMVATATLQQGPHGFLAATVDELLEWAAGFVGRTAPIA